MHKSTFLLALLLAVFCQVCDAEKIVIAHRGASGYLPEHTLEAYAMAYGQGADYIEPDLVRTKDGTFIALHDIHLEGTTNVAEVFPDRHREDGRWYAIDFTMDEIRQLEARERLPNRFPLGKSTFSVPTFEEVIELVQGLNQSTGRDVGVYPEMKAPSFHAAEGLPMEEDLFKILKEYGYEGPDAKVYIQSFEAEPLKRLRHELDCDLPIIMLYGGISVSEAQIEDAATFADGIGPEKGMIERNPDVVKWAHERGLKVHPYTFRSDSLPPKYKDHQEEYHAFYVTYGVDGLFTDFSDHAVQFLESKGLR